MSVERRISDEVPIVLTIAGTDPSGGAGINVDLQVFRDLGCHGAAAITAVVWQNTARVGGWQALDPEVLAAQLRLVAEDLTVGAVKIGMLPGAEQVDVVVDFLKELPASVSTVLDPVMAGGTGDKSLSTPDGRRAWSKFKPHIDLITPNSVEAARLLGRKADAEELGQGLVAAGWRRVLVKGGHLRGADSVVVDWFADAQGVTALAPLAAIDADVRGTGCQLSSAIAALRAQGSSWREAIDQARAYLNELLQERAVPIGEGRPVVVRAGGSP